MIIVMNMPFPPGVQTNGCPVKLFENIATD
jgi:hypothetical protein